MATPDTLLTEDDASAFRDNVSEAWAKVRVRHGTCTMAFDQARGVMHCGQDISKDVAADGPADKKSVQK